MSQNHKPQCTLTLKENHTYSVMVRPLEVGIGHVLGFTLQQAFQDLPSIKIKSLKIKMGNKMINPESKTSPYIDISLDELLLNLGDLYFEEAGEFRVEANPQGLYDTNSLRSQGLPVSNLKNQVLFHKVSTRPLRITITTHQCKGYHLPKQPYCPIAVSYTHLTLPTKRIV